MSQHLNPSIECFQGAKGKMKTYIHLPSKRQQQLPLAAGMCGSFCIHSRAQRESFEVQKPCRTQCSGQSPVSLIPYYLIHSS
ncbi:hypothetical protein LEMLEM_LOCUS24528 [Lemmus lemmus]